MVDMAVQMGGNCPDLLTSTGGTPAGLLHRAACLPGCGPAGVCFGVWVYLYSQPQLSFLPQQFLFQSPSPFPPPTLVV